MIAQESEWYRGTIRRRVAEGALVLNVGSSTKHFVEVQQPYIKKNVLDELDAKHCIVKNVDIRASEGVDIVGDISDPAFIRKLRELRPDVILCGNVIEQVPDRDVFLKGLAALVDGSTILIVSVPHRLPRYGRQGGDEVDTGYRVSVEELSKEFPSLRLVEGEVVSGGFYFSLIARRLSPLGKVWYFMKRIVKFVYLVLKVQWEEAAHVGWAFRRISATCAVYTRPPMHT